MLLKVFYDSSRYATGFRLATQSLLRPLVYCEQMPIPPDPAPCSHGEDMFECRDCLNRLCSDERITTCPDCGGEMENLSKPRPE